MPWSLPVVTLAALLAAIILRFSDPGAVPRTLHPSPAIQLEHSR